MIVYLYISTIIFISNKIFCLFNYCEKWCNEYQLRKWKVIVSFGRIMECVGITLIIVIFYVRRHMSTIPYQIGEWLSQAWLSLGLIKFGLKLNFNLKSTIKLYLSTIISRWIQASFQTKPKKAMPKTCPINQFDYRQPWASFLKLNDRIQ